VVAFGGRHLFPHGDVVVVVPRGRRSLGFGALGVPPLVGTAVPPLVGVAVPPLAGTAVPPLVGVAVPPLAGTAVPPLGGVAAPPPVRPGVGVVEIWRRDGGAWHLDLTSHPVAAWRRGEDGRWHPEAAD
jgi:hypothetical protein